MSALEIEGPTLPMAAGEHPLAEGERLGRYVVIRRVGYGGAGVVYAAFDPQLDRKVAIKLLRPDASQWARERVEREARALGRLGHPNIAAVHDVGHRDSNMYLVMEFVDGAPLREWMRESHPLAAILDAFVQAGTGLAAAHAAGVVHRDFKPDNVLLGGDGRVRVADFGLAQIGESEPSDDGMIVGTPAYMAPEHVANERVDERADQFAFAVTLWEALHGQRPFTDSLDTREHEVAAGPRPRRTVPSWLHAILLRALARSPAARFASMEALLAAIERGRFAARRHARIGVAIGAVAAIATLIVVLASRDGAAAMCTGAEGEASAMWNPERSAAITAAFAKRNGSAQAAIERIDQWRDRWVVQHTEACRATHVAGTQSEQLLDRRMTCLRRLSGEVTAIVERLAAGDPATLAHAGELIAGVGAPSACADVESLEPPQPDDPNVRAQIEALANQSAAIFARRYETASSTLRRAHEELVQRSRTIAHAPHLVRMLARHGLLCALEHHACELETFREATGLAIRATMRTTAAELASVLATTYAEARQDASATAWLEVATALRSDARARRYELDRARTLGYLERYPEALAALSLAFAAIEKDPDHTREEMASLHEEHARLLIGSGDPDAALAAIDRAVALYGATMPDGPSLILALSNRATVQLILGDLAKACETATRALAIGERWYGTNHVALIYPLNSLGTCHLQSGRAEQAIGLLERSLELSRTQHGAESWDYATALANVGGVYAQLSRYDDSIATTARAVAILERLRGVDNASLPTALEILAFAQRFRGLLDDSERSLRRAIAINERTYGRLHPATANGHNELGLTLLAAKNRGAARPEFELSVAIAEAHPSLSPIIAAEARLELAKLLVEDPATHARARTLATTARDAYLTLGEGYDSKVRQADALLALLVR